MFQEALGARTKNGIQPSLSRLVEKALQGRCACRPAGETHHRRQIRRGARRGFPALGRDRGRHLYSGAVRPPRPAAFLPARRRRQRLQPLRRRDRRHRRHAHLLRRRGGGRHGGDDEIAGHRQAAPGAHRQDARQPPAQLPHLPATRRLQPHHLLLRQPRRAALLFDLPYLRVAQGVRLHRHPGDNAELQAHPASRHQGRALLRPRLQPVHRLPPLPGGLQRGARRRLPGSEGNRGPQMGRHHRADADRVRLQVLLRLRHRLPDRRVDGPHARRRAQGGVAGAVQAHLPGRHRRAALRAAGRPG
jgi:hypothetical protein